MSFRLVPKSVTLNDLERRNGPYLFWQRQTSFGGTAVTFMIFAPL